MLEIVAKTHISRGISQRDLMREQFWIGNIIVWQFRGQRLADAAASLCTPPSAPSCQSCPCIGAVGLLLGFKKISPHTFRDINVLDGCLSRRCRSDWTARCVCACVRVHSLRSKEGDACREQPSSWITMLVDPVAVLLCGERWQSGMIFTTSVWQLTDWF